jgi:lactoylglutathione lyase
MDRSENALNVRELNHIALYVRDLDVSINFYEKILELPRLPRPPFDFQGAWFALGQQELHLIVDAIHNNDERHSMHFAMLIDDIYAADAKLKRKGVSTMYGPMPRPDGAYQLFFNDPDGYRLEMISFTHTPA